MCSLIRWWNISNYVINLYFWLSLFSRFQLQLYAVFICVVVVVVVFILAVMMLLLLLCMACKRCERYIDADRDCHKLWSKAKAKKQYNTIQLYRFRCDINSCLKCETPVFRGLWSPHLVINDKNIDGWSAKEDKKCLGTRRCEMWMWTIEELTGARWVTDEP